MSSSLVEVTAVSVLENPSTFSSPFRFEISFNCSRELQEYLEWNVVYVGDAVDNNGDQVLEEVMVGPVALGQNSFLLEAPAPDASRISPEERIGMTGILISAAYRQQKFVQIGYYLVNSLPGVSEEDCANIDFSTIALSSIERLVYSDQPRVTYYPVVWDGNSVTVEPLNADEAARVAAHEAVAGHVEMNWGTDMQTTEMEECDMDGDAADDFSIASNGSDGVTFAADVIQHHNSMRAHGGRESLYKVVSRGAKSSTQTMLERPYYGGPAASVGGSGVYAFVSDEEYLNGLTIINEDSNSMDVARMILQ